MKIKNAIDIARGISAAQNDSSAHPVKFGFLLAFNMKRLQDVLTLFEASRMALINRMAEKLDDGSLNIDASGNVKIIDPLAFNAEAEKLMEEDVPIDLKPIRLSDFPASMPPSIIAGLYDLIEDDIGGGASKTTLAMERRSSGRPARHKV